jgi:hypothetical protein
MVMNNYTWPSLKAFATIVLIVAGGLFVVFPNASCTSESSSLATVVKDSSVGSGPVWKTWYIKFKENTSEGARKYCLFYVENRLMDSLKEFKKGLDPATKIEIQSSHNPFSDTLVYQIRVGLSSYAPGDSTRLGTPGLRIWLASDSIMIPVPRPKFPEWFPQPPTTSEITKGYTPDIERRKPGRRDSIIIGKPGNPPGNTPVTLSAFVACISYENPCSQ